MARPARKYILIPEYRPLFAMQECFGPQHGPLKEPCPTPIPIIGKLLRQTGDDKLTIYEVEKPVPGTASYPVLLTLDNYTLPYSEILNGKKVAPAAALEPVENDHDAVAPVIGNFTADERVKESHVEKPKPTHKIVGISDEVKVADVVETFERPTADVSDDTTNDTPSQTSDDVEKPVETTDVPEEEVVEDSAVSATAETETPELPPEPEVTVTARPGVEVEEISPKVKPYDQMSKKERKEARRKAAEAAAKAGTAQAD